MDDTNKPIVTPSTNYFIQAIEQFKTEGLRKPKNYPSILIVGDSGTGKTASCRTLPPLETAIINVEDKMPSFEGSEKFPYLFPNEKVKFNLPSDVDICLSFCFKEPSIKYIFFDSLTKYFEKVFAFSVEQTKNDKNSFAKFNMFNAMIGGFLEGLKPCGQKFVIVTGIPETLTETLVDGSTTRYRRLYIKGKEWEAKVEKEFTLCLYTDVKKGLPNQPSEYRFLTNDGVGSSAKTPQGMFKDTHIPNDIFAVCKRVKEFYKLD